MTEEDIQIVVTRYILAVFFHSLGGPSWASSDSDGWTDPVLGHCAWDYVDCNYTNNAVQRINTGGQASATTDGGDINMVGSLPTEIRHLTELVTIFVFSVNQAKNPCLVAHLFPTTCVCVRICCHAICLVIVTKPWKRKTEEKKSRVLRQRKNTENLQIPQGCTYL